jgi:hypothetical protein
MVVLLSCSPTRVIILEDVHRPEGLANGFSGGCRAPRARYRDNNNGDERWCGCGKILFVGSCSGVFDSSSSWTSRAMKSGLPPRWHVATMSGEEKSLREDLHRYGSCTSPLRSSSPKSGLPFFCIKGILFGIDQHVLHEATAVITSLLVVPR